MTRPRKTAVHLGEVNQDLPQRHREPFTIDLPDNGSLVVHHANLVFAAESREGDVSTTSLIVGRGGCPCGCKAQGFAFEYRLSPDDARNIAAKLTAIADTVDAQAASAAASLIRKVRGK